MMLVIYEYAQNSGTDGLATAVSIGTHATLHGNLTLTDYSNQDGLLSIRGYTLALTHPPGLYVHPGKHVRS